MNIGGAIKKLRQEKGFSQGELADKIPMSQTSLSMIEQGRKNPSARNLQRIAEILETNVFVIQFLSIEEGDIPLRKRKVFKEMSPAIENFMKSIF